MVTNRHTIDHYLRVQPFVVVSETIVDVIECTHSIPQCTAITSVAYN